MLFLFCGLPHAVVAGQVDSFCRLVAARHGARVLLARHAPTSGAAGHSAYLQEVLAIVNGIGLRERFGVIDCTLGCTTPLLWQLQERGLAFALVVNPYGVWPEDYLDSPAHLQFAGVMAKYTSMSRPQGGEGGEHEAWWLADGGAALKLVDERQRASAANGVFTRSDSEFEAVVHASLAALRREDQAADFAGTLRHTACVVHWQVRDYTNALRKKPRLRVPAAVLVSAFAPATVGINSAKRLHKEFLRSDATLGFIPQSKCWVFAPTEHQPARRAMLRALKAMIPKAMKKSLTNQSA